MGNRNFDLARFPFAKHHWLQSGFPNMLISAEDSTRAYFQGTSSITDEDIGFYTFRSLHQKYLVSVLAVIEDKSRGKGVTRRPRLQGCPLFLVLIQNICYRLPDMGALSYQDALYIIRQGVKAATCLLSLFPAFLFQPQAIGINDKGECKFWVNSNYFNNSPETPIENIHFNHIQNQQSSNNCCLNSVQVLEGNEVGNNNCELTLRNLIALIESKMAYTITKEQEEIYRSSKKKHLSISIPNSDDNDSSDFEYFYNKQCVEKWINDMCAQARVTQNYKISIPTKPQMPGKTKLTRVKSNAQFFEIDRHKPAHSEISPIKLNIYKIVAHHKTSLKKLYKLTEEGKGDSFSSKSKNEDKIKPEESSAQEVVKEISERKKDNAHSQLTLKSGFTHFNSKCNNYESRCSCSTIKRVSQAQGILPKTNHQILMKTRIELEKAEGHRKRALVKRSSQSKRQKEGDEELEKWEEEIRKISWGSMGRSQHSHSFGDGVSCQVGFQMR